MNPKTGHPPKKRNPQDSTRRNVQAANKRFEILRAIVLKINERVSRCENRLFALEQDKPFATQQKALGYRHSTSFPASIRVKG